MFYISENGGDVLLDPWGKLEHVTHLGNQLKNFKKAIKKEGKKVLSAMPDINKLPIRAEQDFEITDLDKWLTVKNPISKKHNEDGWHISWNRGDDARGNFGFPLVLNNKFLPNCKKLPFIGSILQDFSKHHVIHMAGISLLKSMSKIHPHDDIAGLKYGMLTLNYCIQCDGRVGLNVIPAEINVGQDGDLIQNTPNIGQNILIVDNKTYIHNEGEYIIFDACKTHSAENLSKNDRLVLIIAFCVKPKNSLKQHQK